jgi:integrase
MKHDDTKTGVELDQQAAKPTRTRAINVRSYRDVNHPNLKFVVRYREAGRRRRKFFQTRADADLFAKAKNADIKHSGEYAAFPVEWRVMADEAMQALHPFKKDIRDATAHYLAYLKATQNSCSAEQLVEEMLKAKKADKLSMRHISDLKSRLSYFSAKFDGLPVAAITTRELDDWLRELPVAPSTRNHYRSVVIQAYNFAIGRGYAVANPAAATVEVKGEDGDIGILSVTQTARLLEATDRELLPYIAIGAFAGLRSSEIERLDWSNINFESNLIKVEARKGTRKNTRRRRFVRIQPNLREWLRPLQQLKGPVAPQENFRELFDAAREAAGITQWPVNALRHSYGSYHLARFNDVNALALEMGNSPEMIFNHYRELVTPSSATAYWSIAPARRARKIVSMNPS